MYEIPNEFIYKNNDKEFSTFFLFFLWHLGDIDPSRIEQKKEKVELCSFIFKRKS